MKHLDDVVRTCCTKFIKWRGEPEAKVMTTAATRAIAPSFQGHSAARGRGFLLGPKVHFGHVQQEADKDRYDPEP